MLGLKMNRLFVYGVDPSIDQGVGEYAISSGRTGQESQRPAGCSERWARLGFISHIPALELHLLLLGQPPLDKQERRFAEEVLVHFHCKSGTKAA